MKSVKLEHGCSVLGNLLVPPSVSSDTSDCIRWEICIWELALENCLRFTYLTIYACLASVAFVFMTIILMALLLRGRKSEWPTRPTDRQRDKRTDIQPTSQADMQNLVRNPHFFLPCIVEITFLRLVKNNILLFFKEDALQACFLMECPRTSV